MSTRHIALVPEMGVNASELARVSAALQKQVTRDLSPIWGISATVDAFPQIEDVPAGYWPLVLTYRDLGADAGIHMDASGQPYAVVEMSPSWSLTASHVCLELICDPFGNRMFAGPSPRVDQGQVEYLANICDPCEDAAYAYIVNDVLVSDFCTPAFWEPASTRERYSFTGAVQAPLEVLPGGHLRWYDPATLNWWIRRVAESSPIDRNLGRADSSRSTVREFLDARAPHHLLSTKMTVDAFEARMGSRRRQALQASQSRAFSLRASFGQAKQASEDAVHVVRSSGRQQVFGALRRASLGASAASRDAAAARDGDFGRAAPSANELGETVLDADVEELPSGPEERAAPPPVTAPSREQVSQAAPRTVPPPLPQTPAHPPAVPQASSPSPAARPNPVAPPAARPSTVASPSSFAPASFAPFSRDSKAADSAYRNRMLAVAGFAAAFVLGIGIHRVMTAPASASSSEGAVPIAAARPTEPQRPAVIPPTPPATASVSPPVQPSAQPAPPAAAAAVPPPSASPPSAVSPAPAQPAAVSPNAPVQARPKAPVAAAAPVSRPARQPEAKAQSSLDDLIDDRR